MSAQLIYGVNPVREALNAGQPIERILLARKDAGVTKAIVASAQENGVRIEVASKKELAKPHGR